MGDGDHLRSKCEKLQTELDNRNITIRTVQRNYENLSSAYEARATEADEARRKLNDEEVRGTQLATQLEAALNRVASLELKLKQAAEREAAAAADRAAQGKNAMDANIAVERAKALSAKVKENETRMREMEIEVTTSRVRQEDLRRREMSAGDDKRRAERDLAALKAEVGGLESELRAARDALAAANAEATNQNRAHAALQGQIGRIRDEMQRAVNEARRERARGDQEHARAERAERALNGEMTQRLIALEREAAQFRSAAEAMTIQRDDAREDAEQTRRRAAEESSANEARIAALRAELDAAVKERDAARDAATRATEATRGMAGDAAESLQSLDVRLDAIEMSAIDGLTAAEKAAARSHEEMTRAGKEALRRVEEAERHIRDLEDAIARVHADAETQKMNGDAALRSAWAKAKEAAQAEADAKAKAAEEAEAERERARRLVEDAMRRAKEEAEEAAAEYEASKKDASFSLEAAHKTIRQLEDAMSDAHKSHDETLRREREFFERELASTQEKHEHQLTVAADAAAVDRGNLLSDLDEARSRADAAEEELFAAREKITALKKKCEELEEAIDLLKDGVGAAEDKALATVRETLGKALKDSARTRDQIVAVGEKIVSMGLENAPGMTGGGEGGDDRGGGGGSAVASAYASAVAEWRDAIDLIAFHESTKAAVMEDEAASVEPPAVEDAVTEVVDQVVWRFTRLDKLARAAAEVAVVANETRAKGVGLSEKERELEMSVKKLTRAEEALESAVTCMQCMGIFKQPVTCVPCGHTYCGGCYTRGGNCPECDADVEHVVEATLLESVASKYEYKITTLRSLARLVAY